MFRSFNIQINNIRDHYKPINHILKPFQTFNFSGVSPLCGRMITADALMHAAASRGSAEI
uniref:Uncharacterized protein n=2 Tax=Rhizophagus irregularis TaxID=588596 RepID=U9SU29_RHIID